jgi:hypothetical protein
MAYVHKLTEIPKGEHYVIIEMTSVFIPGDERSRTHPGHGYPERTEYYTQMQVFTSEEEWAGRIAAMMERDPRGEKFVAYKVPALAKITHEVTVSA